MPNDQDVSTDLAKWRPEDQLVKIWPSDRFVNIDADARVAAAASAAAFRRALQAEKESRP